MKRRSFLSSLADPRAYTHFFRMLHYYNYTHVAERRRLHLGADVRLAPTVSFANGDRIWIGARSHIGAGCRLWAGDAHSRIVVGADALFGPEVFLTASNYQTQPGIPIMRQPRAEQDVIVGSDVWLGARVIVLAGVEIGAGCVVGAGSVVTKSLPPGSIAVGNPARVVRQRGATVSAEPP